MRGRPKGLTTTLILKKIKGTLLIAVPNSKKVRYKILKFKWIIRSQAPKIDKQDHGEGSTTRWFWA